MALIMMTHCWPCQFGDHYEPPQVHPWMGRGDAEHAGYPWPLPAEIAAQYSCACECAGGPGLCIPAEDLPEDLREAMQAIQALIRQALNNQEDR